MRKLMLGAAMSALMAAGGCSTTQVQQLDTITTSFIQSVQELTAASCGIIPEAGAIVSIFNATVGATIATVGAAICKAAPPPASAAFQAIPLKAAGSTPVVVGTVNGVAVTGWRAGAVKFGRAK